MVVLRQLFTIPLLQIRRRTNIVFHDVILSELVLPLGRCAVLVLDVQIHIIQNRPHFCIHRLSVVCDRTGINAVNVIMLQCALESERES